MLSLDNHGLGESSDSPFIVSFMSDKSDTLEYNDSIKKAFEAIIGKSYQTKIYPAYDIDYFKVTMSKSGEFKIK